MTGQALAIDNAAEISRERFAYASLPEADAIAAKAAATRIQRRNHKMVEAIIENGSDLLAIKERLPHGQFGAWVAEACGVSERTAQNYMAAARTFAAKTAMVADLSPSTLYPLAASEEVARQVIERREAGEAVDERAIGDLLWQHREDRKKAKFAAKLTLQQRKRQRAREERDQRANQKAQREREEQAARRYAATAEAAALIADKMPADVPTLVALLELTWGSADLLRALKGVGSADLSADRYQGSDRNDRS